MSFSNRPILIFRHEPHEGAGYLGDFLVRRGLAYRLIRVDQGESIPEDVERTSALIFMGGHMSANDDLPWIGAEMRLIRTAMEADVPILGNCLGGQLISKAVGGSITRNPVPEIGWLRVQPVAGPAAGDWLGGLEPDFDVFQWHGETFSIPPRATRILQSPDCANQAFAVGRTLAVQFHLEMTEPMVVDWAEKGACALAETSATVQGRADMCSGLAARVGRLHHVADVLYARWLSGLR